MRNYWALLPAITVCVVLAIAYAVPTLINPQLTTNALALFRREDDERPDPLTRRERTFRRRAAIAVLVAMVGLVGFNISLNREANGCYQVAKAWGATEDPSIDDPCIDKIFGAYFTSAEGKVTEDFPQKIDAYQLVTKDSPKYLQWIANRPNRDETDLVVGAPFLCEEVKAKESDTTVTIVSDISQPCPQRPKIGLVPVDLKKPLGDRKVVTVDGAEIRRINPDMPSWGTVLKKLATGG